jgi:carotenoid cleavage dioxygenase-like enzyme
MSSHGAPVIDHEECETEGVVPADLNGALYRLGGQWYYPPKFKDDIPLHADGFMSMFRVVGGRAFYRSRFVETERLRVNREKEKMRFGYYRNRVTDDPDVAAFSASAANTTAFFFAGKLFALKEDSQPYEIDPITLETRGIFDFHGAFKSRTFTAHPKIDGENGELITFGYQAVGAFSPDVFIYVFAPDGELRNEIRIKMPVLDMIHDMAITQDHILLPLVGFAIDRGRLSKGGPLWRWDPAAPARIGVVRRDGDGSDLRWFTGTKQCLLHVYNAYSTGHQITLDAPFYRGNPFPFLPSVDGSLWTPASGDAFLRRLTLDLSRNDEKWTENVLFETKIGDLGDVDPRKVGSRHRYCFAGHEVAVESDEPKVDFVRPPWPMANSYVRFDVEAKKQTLLRLAGHQSLGECVFVPRTQDSAEGEGYLLGVADDYADGTSFLIIADAQHLERGPIAKARLPYRAAPQVHGCWVASSECPMWSPQRD